MSAQTLYVEKEGCGTFWIFPSAFSHMTDVIIGITQLIRLTEAIVSFRIVYLVFFDMMHEPSLVVAY